MKKGIGLIIVLAGVTGLGCNHHEEIILGKVYGLPEYFSENYHFGKDIQSIDELNGFILVTGKIDTTTETPPRRLAVVAIGHNKIYLTLKKMKIDDNKTTEQYSGSGYFLDLIYKEKRIQNHSPLYEGYFVITHNDQRSEYDVVGASGYY